MNEVQHIYSYKTKKGKIEIATRYNKAMHRLLIKKKKVQREDKIP